MSYIFEIKVLRLKAEGQNIGISHQVIEDLTTQCALGPNVIFSFQSSASSLLTLGVTVSLQFSLFHMLQ
jgi:hypothetical protein